MPASQNRPAVLVLRVPRVQAFGVQSCAAGKENDEKRGGMAHEFMNVTVLAGAVAEQLKSSFDPNATMKRVFTLEEATVYCGMLIDFAMILEPVLRG